MKKSYTPHPIDTIGIMLPVELTELVEATLKFVSTSDGAMIVRPNDDYYGSDFAKIMRVVDMLNEQGFIHPDSVDFDDSASLDKELGTLDDITTYED